MVAMREKEIEQSLRRAVLKRGGLCLKLDSSSKKGIQDRLVLLPGRRVFFVELKRPDGGRLSELQKVRRTQLQRMGFSSLRYAPTNSSRSPSNAATG